METFWIIEGVSQLTKRRVQGRYGQNRSQMTLMLVALVLLTYLVRLMGIQSQGLWRDEVDQWRFAFFGWRELLANLTRPGWNGPLYSILLRVWIEFAGDTPFAMRFLSTLWGVLSVPLLFRLSTRLCGKRCAMIAALLTALSPYMVWYAQEVKMYTWVPFLVLLACYALDRACQTSRLAWWGVVLVATSLAFYSHILTALLVPVLVLWFLLCRDRHPRAVVGGVLVLAGLVLPYLPLLRWQLPLLLQQRATGFPRYSLGQMIQMLLTGWSGGIYQGRWGGDAGLWAIVAAFALLVSVGLVRLALSRRVRLVQLGVWLILPLLAVWLVSLRSPIFTDRYLIWSAPAFYILGGVGLDALRRRWPSLAAVLLALLMIVNLHGLLMQMAHPIKPQFERVVEVIAARRGQDDLLLFQIPYNHHVYAFYADGDLGRWAEAPYTNWQLPDGRYQVGESYVTQEMVRIVGDTQRVWLVYSEVALWDARELVKAWLDTTCRTDEAYYFTGVSLFLYRCAVH